MFKNLSSDEYLDVDGQLKAKDCILQILKSRKNSYISGEELASKLSLSRTAVWKHVKKLKRDGYRIVVRDFYGIPFNVDITATM